MEDRRGKGRVRLAFSQDTVKILQFARAAGGDDRNRDLFGNRPRQVKVKPILASILVRRISPAPKVTALRTHSRTSNPVAVRPPWI